jgi:hypothetical protein
LAGAAALVAGAGAAALEDDVPRVREKDVLKATTVFVESGVLVSGLPRELALDG